MSDPRIDSIYVALRYAPLGVRDAASRGLQDLLGEVLSPALEKLEQAQAKHASIRGLISASQAKHASLPGLISASQAKHAGLPDFAPKLLSLEAERKRLEGAYNDALVFFSAIAGERANGHQTHEQTAREWLMRHGGGR